MQRIQRSACRIAAVASLLSALVLPGCFEALGPSGLAALAAGEQRWAARPFADYSFEMRESCFCPSYGWVRATVVQGVVVRLESVESGESGATLPVDPSSWATIETLFTQIRSVGLQEGGAYERLSVRFDAELGYPMWIAADAAKGVYDAGFTIEVRSVSDLD